MKKFLLHTSILVVLIIGSIVWIATKVNGYSDPYYLRVSSPRQANLIIGTSKAAQGIQPSELQTILGENFYNYAFSIYASPYGEVYFNSIKDKLEELPNQTFVLVVDAWSLSSITENGIEPSEYREEQSFLFGIDSPTKSPNLKYLMNFFDGQYYTILTNNSPMYLHSDGWLEINLEDNKASVERRSKFAIQDYRKKVHKYQFSTYRHYWCLKTIDYLNQYGEVYLVRLPVRPEMMEVENSLMPDFNEKMKPMQDKVKKYIDLSIYNEAMNYNDGVHLNKESGAEISKIIANEILKFKTK